MRVPAVVGSWPQPFLDGYEGKARPVAVECLGGGTACAEVDGRLEEAGVGVPSRSPGGAIRVLVGPWSRVRQDPAAAQIEDGPQASGVFAEFHREGDGYRLTGLDEAGDSRVRVRCRRRLGRRHPPLRSAAGVGRHAGRREPRCGPPPVFSMRLTCATITR